MHEGKTLGQIAHEAGERAGHWARKWSDLGEGQRAEWEEIGAAVASAALAAPTVLLRRLAAVVQGCCHDGDVVQIDGDMLRIGDLLDEADALLAPKSPAPQEESHD